jgi:hypothetical protein
VYLNNISGEMFDSSAFYKDHQRLICLPRTFIGQDRLHRYRRFESIRHGVRFKRTMIASRSKI